jgi:hypothetical protein
MAGGFAFKVTTNFFDRMDWLLKLTDVALVGSVYRESERLMTMAKQLTPVDTGNLRASGRVEGPLDVSSHGVTYVLAYGGAALEYALRIHEDLNMRHAVGQAKFLETPVREEVGSGRSETRVMADMRAQGIV